MARLIASLSLAAGLMVALAATAFAQDGSTFVCLSGVKSKDRQKIKSIFAVREDERDEEQRTKLAQACVDTLKNAEASKWPLINPSKAVKVFEELKYLVNQLSDWKAQDLSMPGSWLGFLTLQEETLRCSDNSLEIFLQQALIGKWNPWQFNYVQDCFGQYLVSCGYEKQYKILLKNIEKPNHSRKYSTLDKLFRSVFWPQFKHSMYRVQIFVFGDDSPDLVGYRSKIRSILLACRMIFDIENIDVEKSCKDLELRERLAILLRKSGLEPELYKLTKDYFKLYLRECGYEESFRSAMAEYNVDIDKSNSPFASYLWGDFKESYKNNKNEWKTYNSHADEILFALEILDRLHEEFACTLDKTRLLYRMQLHAKELEYTKFIKCVDDIFAKYLRVCAGDFKQKIKQLEDSQSEELVSIKEYSKFLEAEFKNKYKDDPLSSRQIVNNLLGREFWGDKMDYFEDLKRKCHSLSISIRTYLEAMRHDCTPAIQDAEIGKFINDIGFCFLGQMEPNNSQHVPEIFGILRAPYYPTQAEAPSVKPEECRRY